MLKTTKQDGRVPAEHISFHDLPVQLRWQDSKEWLDNRSFHCFYAKCKLSLGLRIWERHPKLHDLISDSLPFSHSRTALMHHPSRIRADSWCKGDDSGYIFMKQTRCKHSDLHKSNSASRDLHTVEIHPRFQSQRDRCGMAVVCAVCHSPIPDQRRVKNSPPALLIPALNTKAKQRELYSLISSLSDARTRVHWPSLCPPGVG